MPAELRIDGVVGRDPDIRFFDTGSSVCNFPVAVDEYKWDGKESVKIGVTWYQVASWGEDGQAVAEVLKKGDRVVVLGGVKLSTYEKDGETLPKIEVKAKSVSIVPKPLKKAKSDEGGDPW